MENKKEFNFKFEFIDKGKSEQLRKPYDCFNAEKENKLINVNIYEKNIYGIFAERPKIFLAGSEK